MSNYMTINIKITLCPQCHNDIHEFYGKNAGRYPLIKR